MPPPNSLAVPRGSIELLVKNRGDAITGGDFVTWAVAALTDGWDSPSLRRLAGLDASVARLEAMPFFEGAVKELELPLPDSKDTLLRSYLRVIAQDIVNGARPAAEALDVIHTEVLGPLAHPEDLMPWCFLWEGLDPVTFNSLDDGTVAAAARALAKQALEKNDQ